jgi:hypothetical protein
MSKLIFGAANAKLKGLEKVIGGKIFTFSLLSGIDCPYAKECKSMAVVAPSGKIGIQDGPDTLWRCFSASQEVLFPAVYKSRKHNADTILPIAATSPTAAADLICENLPKKYLGIRCHVGGDFSTLNYFRAWIEVCKRNPSKIFYAYTKSLPFWIKELANIPSNFILTASYGGHKDDLIAKYNLRFAKVVFSVDEAASLGLEIDKNDFSAYNPLTKNDSFALLIHGVQPKGSKAGKAVRALKGVGSYGRGDTLTIKV